MKHELGKEELFQAAEKQNATRFLQIAFRTVEAYTRRLSVLIAEDSHMDKAL